MRLALAGVAVTKAAATNLQIVMLVTATSD